jgi:hypothetical protein
MDLTDRDHAPAESLPAFAIGLAEYDPCTIHIGWQDDATLHWQLGYFP